MGLVTNNKNTLYGVCEARVSVGRYGVAIATHTLFECIFLFKNDNYTGVKQITQTVIGIIWPFQTWIAQIRLCKNSSDLNAPPVT
jgi:hypothetical protein